MHFVSFIAMCDHCASNIIIWLMLHPNYEKIKMYESDHHKKIIYIYIYILGLGIDSDVQIRFDFDSQVLKSIQFRFSIRFSIQLK